MQSAEYEDFGGTTGFYWGEVAHGTVVKLKDELAKEKAMLKDMEVLSLPITKLYIIKIGRS